MEAKKGKKFSFYFAVATSLLIAITIIVTTFFIVLKMEQVRAEYRKTSYGYENYILDNIRSSLYQDVRNGNYMEVKKTIALLTGDTYNYVNYAYLYNSNTQEILWASDNSFYNFQSEILKDTVLPARDEINHLSRRDVPVVSVYRVVVGFSGNKEEDQSFQDMMKQLQMFVIIFIMVSVIVSAIISAKINRPLMDVVKSVQEFGKGNFTQELKNTGFEEIDKLVEAYNNMASQLSDLYESLEAKVEERTKELEEANLKLKETQTMMVHSEKMRSLGELVAGIAHEINNPVNFIYGNIMILDTYQKDLIALADKYAEADSEIDPVKMKAIQEHKQKIDFDFLRDDIGDLIKSCIEGVERTKNIILDLKNFSRMDEMVFSECNIPKEIDTTLNILNNKIKNRITVHKNYEPDVPKIEAYGGQINQVFMNILDNAQGAIKGTGDIYINVKKDGEYVVIEFQDTGCGIKEENLHKVFEPFFTTKPVGQGTGLGMSIAYRVIKAHNGKINVESEVDKGTKFTLALPIEHKVEEDAKENA